MTSKVSPSQAYLSRLDVWPLDVNATVAVGLLVMFWFGVLVGFFGTKGEVL